MRSRRSRAGARWSIVSALSLRSFEQARSDPVFWGRLVENAAGAHLLNHLQGLSYEVTYWRERNDEVDFVVLSAGAPWALEIKSGRPERAPGLAALSRKASPQVKPLIVGSGGLGLQEFFSTDPRELLIP